jgi:NADH:ubiquinone oxidoreductase subunit C
LDGGWINAGEWPERARSLRAEGWTLQGYCGVDRLGLGGPRFEMVAHLLNREERTRDLLHVAATGENPTIPSITEVWPTADWMEREAFDMFGIVFDGHPNLTRILMPDEWEGHPLRKDYGVGKIPIDFLPQPLLQIDSPGQAPDSAEANVLVDRLGQPQPAAPTESS